MAGRWRPNKYERFLRGHVPGCERAYLQDTGGQAVVRQSLSIDGVETLTGVEIV